MSDIQFIPGLIVKAPNPKAPEFVKASLSIKRAELIAWLHDRTEDWINVDVKESKSGKWYVAVNAYKREEGAPSRSQPAERSQRKTGSDFVAFDDDIDLPF